MREIKVKVTSLLTFEFDDDVSDNEIEDFIINEMEDEAIVLYREDINDIEIDF